MSREENPKFRSTKARSRTIILLTLFTAGLTSPSPLAFASFYDMYRADYTKGAFCVAIAGACASDDNSENSFFQNPASLESGTPDIIFDGDYNPGDNAEPGMKVGDKIDQTTFMGGIANSGKTWGLGVAFSGRISKVNAKATFADSDTGDKFTAATENSSTTLLLNVPYAYRVNPRLSLGMALLGMYYGETFTVTGSPKSSTTPIDKLPQVGFSFGGLYSLGKSFRFGSWLRTPLTYYVKQTIDTQVGTTEKIIDETVALHYPWIWASGVSYMPWQDKKTLMLDIDLVGTTDSGLERTLDRFATVSNATSVLRNKGQKLVIEPHLAWRAPWYKNSKGTYTVGSYYENSRWEGLSGRLHGVTSMAYHLGFLEVIAAIDVSKEYFSLQLSFR